MQPELLDVVEVLVDFPEHRIQAGSKGPCPLLSRQRF